MTVRGGSTILRAPEVPKNYSCQMTQINEFYPSRVGIAHWILNYRCKGKKKKKDHCLWWTNNLIC